MIIDRRNLLTSLAATTACTSLGSTVDAGATAHRGATQELGHSRGGWCLAMESRQQPTDHIVDFWARPWCEIPYTRHLPREIARAAMWFDLTNCRTLESIDQSFKHYCFDWADKPRRFAAHIGGIEGLSSTLRSLIGDEASNSAARTAFLSLDSFDSLREPSWAEVLPAFRSCYDRIIGHFHLPQRGLRQWRKFLNSHFGSEHNGGYFQEFFTDAAAQCDAIILTSSALVESDIRCCPRSSTEELVGKLMRELGCALLTPAVLERIVGDGEQSTMRTPRFFALSSLALETMDDYYFSEVMIGRQADLVRGSFGDGIPDEQLVLVASPAEGLNSDFVDEIRRATGGAFFTTTVPAYEIENRGSVFNLLQTITLWPFKFDEQKLRLA